MEKVNISVLSYEHDGAREPYSLVTFGEDFEITVAPENILMGMCAHHEASRLMDEGIDASILTLGGGAISNKRIIEKINEKTGIEVPVEADTESYSVASNLKSLSKYTSPFIVICQRFARLRTSIHSRYHLGEGRYNIIDWETYIEDNELSEFEHDLYNELDELRDIPLQRKVLEGVLTVLAYLDPKDGLTKSLTLLRQKLRKEDPEDNIFNKTGLS